MKNEILIGNNCLVGFIYRDILKYEYQTPFIWSRIWNDDFIKLLEHNKEIDFENFELKKVNKKINNKDNDFYILLDNLVKIFFEHNFFFYHTDSVVLPHNTVRDYTCRMKKNAIFIIYLHRYFFIIAIVTYLFKSFSLFEGDNPCYHVYSSKYFFVSRIHNNAIRTKTKGKHPKCLPEVKR